MSPPNSTAHDPAVPDLTADSASQVPEEPASATASAEVSEPLEAQQQETLPDELLATEPLTPELLEDEAIRGDFVLRWAIVGVALLMGISPIQETLTLVHIKSGQSLAVNGWLPAATDRLSMTAGDRPWVNLAWLFDLCAAAGYALGGPVALSILQGVIVALTFVLINRASHPGIRTWWSSVAAGCGLVAISGQISLQPELITLVGLTGLMYWIVRCAESERPSWPWWTLVPLMALWAQLDPRAFLGGILLLVYLIGQLLTPRTRQTWPADGRQTPLTWVLLGSLVVLCVHPFVGAPWGNVWNWYAWEYPAQLSVLGTNSPARIEYSSLWSTANWRSESLRQITLAQWAALGLVLMALVSLVLNRVRVSLGHVGVFLTANFLAAFGLHELTAVAVVNAVLAGLHGQEWYYANGYQRYVVSNWSIFYSRAGRAVTLLAIVFLGVSLIGGRFAGPDGLRTGVGWHPELANLISAYEQSLANTYDQRAFHLQLRQGDLLIWNDRPSFVDSRVGLFYGDSNELPMTDAGNATQSPSGAPRTNWLAIHDLTRRTLRQSSEPVARANPAENAATSVPANDAARAYAAVFREVGISHVLPRLSGTNPPPDYLTLGSLLRDSDWTLTNLTSATAVFHWSGSGDQELQRFAEQHRFSILDETLRQSKPLSLEVRTWAQPPVSTARWLQQERTTLPNGVQLAAHYLTLAESTGTSLPVSYACALEAVRLTQAALPEAPRSAASFETLARAYRALDSIELSLLKLPPGPAAVTSHYLQAVACLQQAIQLNPSALTSYQQLMELYQSRQRVDLTASTMERWRLHLAQLPPTEEIVRLRQQVLDAQLNVEDQVAKLTTALNEQLGKPDANRFVLAQQAAEAGMVAWAIETVKADAVGLAGQPQTIASLAGWLLETGAGLEAEDRWRELEANSQIGPLPGSRAAYATFAISQGDYPKAITMYATDLVAQQTDSAQALLGTTALTRSTPVWLGPDTWPLAAIGAAIGFQQQQQPRLLAIQLWRIQALLEQGDSQTASSELALLLSDAKPSSFRDLLLLYWFCLQGDTPPPGVREAEIPTTPDLLQSESDHPQSKTAPPAAN